MSLCARAHVLISVNSLLQCAPTHTASATGSNPLISSQDFVLIGNTVLNAFGLNRKTLKAAKTHSFSPASVQTALAWPGLLAILARRFLRNGWDGVVCTSNEEEMTTLAFSQTPLNSLPPYYAAVSFPHTWHPRWVTEDAEINVPLCWESGSAVKGFLFYVLSWSEYNFITIILIIMVIFKGLSLKALGALQDKEGGAGRGNKIITQMFLSGSA